jgi:tetratricopeptide (TPR) repeat protein
LPSVGVSFLSPAVPPPAPRFQIVLAGAFLVLAALGAYHNIFSAPFVFDDIPAIVENASIRSLREALSPPTEKGTSAIGRPVYNLSLAANYALGGLDVRGYHAVNVLIHTLAGLTLFGLARLLLLRPKLAPRFGPDALPLAFAIALVWTVHPLQTESVTFTVQRTESLMGLFYLLTLYAFARGTESIRPALWYTLSIVACLLGVGTKEVAATAPLLVLLCDRAVFAGTFREAWRRRRGFYLSLAATWLPLAWLMAGTSNRGGTVGLGLGMSSWTYLITQCRAIVLYLRLSLWPHPLVMDYGSATASDLTEVFPQAVLLVALVAGTGLALWKKPMLGFLGAWFFFILAPSSSFVPLRTQTMAEHRMYLSLAAIVAITVSALWLLAGRRGLIAVYALAAGLVCVTVRRNEDYRSSIAIWTDTVEKCPGNARAHYSLGVALSAAGRVDEAIAHYKTALDLDPDYKEHHKLALALAQTGHLTESLAHFEASLRLNPDFAEAHDNYGVALMRAHRPQDALSQYTEALRLDPDNAVAHYNFANALVALERVSEATSHYREAVRLKPDYASAHGNLANALLLSDHPAEAITHYETALNLDPANANARTNLGLARAALQAGQR